MDEETRGLAIRATHAVGRLAGLAEALPGSRLLVEPFLRREALLSSRILERSGRPRGRNSEGVLEQRHYLTGALRVPLVSDARIAENAP